MQLTSGKRHYYRHHSCRRYNRANSGIYTNTYDVLKPEVEPVVENARDAISKVDGEDVVEKTGEVTDKIKDVTDKIKVNNPLEPKE